ncbi:MAG: hypothetical protein K6A69_05695 [Lachnospiraceae bacterium]|nr:hypothetical protein [Lachnospiraceae bacterium]
MKKKTVRFIALLLVIFMAVMAVASMLLSGCAATETQGNTSSIETKIEGCDYTVTLPAGYDEEGTTRYPCFYLMPSNGLDASQNTSNMDMDEFMDSLDGVEMIIVSVSFEENTDPYKIMHDVIAEVDASFRTVPDPEARVIAGDNVGGYLAMALAYTDGNKGFKQEADTFMGVGCIQGNFTGEDNPWIEKYGDLSKIITDGKLTYQGTNEFYTYMSAASEEPGSYVKGGANKIISDFIERGTAYDSSNYAYYGNGGPDVINLTIKNGMADDAFYANEYKDLVKGYSDRLMKDLISGHIETDPAAIEENEAEVRAFYTLNMDEKLSSFFPGEDEVITLSYVVTDPETNERLADPVTEDVAIAEGQQESEYPRMIPNVVRGEFSNVVLYATVLGYEYELASTPLIRKQEADTSNGEYFMDLSGGWQFNTVNGMNITSLPSDYKTWETVTPCLGWWDSSFAASQDMSGYMGAVWYAKEFSIPSDFPAGEGKNYELSLGCIDETDVCFVNGEMVGYTGADPETLRPVDNAWDRERNYTVPSELLNVGGVNEILLLVCNTSGDGGWYSGHPMIKLSDEEAAPKDVPEKNDSGFIEITMPSAYRASALKAETDTVDEDMLILLPKGYDDEKNAAKAYPVVYVLHQMGSTPRSYAADHMDEMILNAMEEGTLPEMILVLPNSSGESWWRGDWDKMVAEEIIPYIDSNYRTMNTRDARYIVGASMGGCGAYEIALNHPDLFSGVASFFGAINMGDNPLKKMLSMSGSDLSQFKHFMVVGNRDLYKFGIPTILLDRHLREQGVEHFFELGDGGHDSEFCMPYVVKAFSYIMDTGASYTMEDRSSEDAAYDTNEEESLEQEE